MTDIHLAFDGMTAAVIAIFLCSFLWYGITGRWRIWISAPPSRSADPFVPPPQPKRSGSPLKSDESFQERQQPHG
jgi:hypothetical protein